MLYLALQPSQQVKMTAHRYRFLDDAGITLKMISGERGEETHV
jgi:hypothetical protein